MIKHMQIVTSLSKMQTSTTTCYKYNSHDSLMIQASVDRRLFAVDSPFSIGLLSSDMMH